MSRKFALIGNLLDTVDRCRKRAYVEEVEHGRLSATGYFLSTTSCMWSKAHLRRPRVVTDQSLSVSDFSVAVSSVSTQGRHTPALRNNPAKFHNNSTDSLGEVADNRFRTDGPDGRTGVC